jgi:hypothetical protein
MSAENEALVRRFYEEMNNDRNNELARQLFTADHQMHDPQVPTADGPEGMVAAVSTYQTAVNGHWEIAGAGPADHHLVVRGVGFPLRHLTLNPTRDYQPLGRPPGPPPRKRQQPDPS